MKNIITVFLLLLFQTTLAQFHDDFTDGDLTSNPTWSGSISDFIVNATNQLQLNNSVAATSSISTPLALSLPNHFEWHAYVKQSFAGSANNFGRIYLMSNQSNLTGSLNGYYLQFGEAGSNDAIELFRQTGSTSVSVCRATSGGIASSFALRVKVIRNAPGSWELYVDYNGGMNFVLEANGTDATYNSASFFGIRCTYTASNSTNFYYDDFIASEEGFVDMNPPVLNNIEVISASSILLTFSEPLESGSAENVTNYLVDHGIGNPVTAVLQPDGKSVVISFFTGFLNGLVHTVTVSHIEDSNSNILESQDSEFLFFQPVAETFRDIIFSEIFPDPTPQVGMPDAEFVEIYNRSNSPFDVAGWKLSDGSSIATLPTKIILPNEYWVVTATSNISKFDAEIHLIGVSNFPTLNNAGDKLTLKSAAGLLIDSLNYSLQWYHDENKEEGGWTLELISPDDVCKESSNWSASLDPLGGTPGKVNSIFSNEPDLEGPKLTGVSVLSAMQFKIDFDEKLNTNAATNAIIELIPSIGVSQAAFVNSELTGLIVTLTSPLQKQLLYTITVLDITDCPGNEIEPEFDASEFYFLENVTVNPKEIIITEILADPEPIVGLPNAEYVELYNRTDKPFDLLGWKLFDEISSATLPKFVLFPQTYLLLTASANVSKFSPNVNVMGVGNFPSINNGGESIFLKAPSGVLVDSLKFNLSWYRDQNKQDGGWSLELIDVENICGEAGNWSASESVLGGTPGSQNSIFANKPDLTGPKLVSVKPLGETELLLEFDEKLDKATPQQISITISPVVNVSAIKFNSIELRAIKISFSETFLKQQLYTIIVSNVFDCSGNMIQEDFSQLEFALPEIAAPGDIIINEILFNPRPNGVDFVELINISSKYISLKELAISNYNDMSINNKRNIAITDKIIGPSQYFVLTPDPEKLADEYPKGKIETFEKVTLPSLPDDAGTFAVVTQADEVIDYLIYNKDYHSALLRDDEGVSLERINLEVGPNNSNNWKSAIASSGYATPGFQNSNFANPSLPAQGEVVVNPEIFAPASGANDFAQIQFWFDQVGLSANVKVFDQQGRLIRTLANNEIIAPQGFFRWDGDQDDGTKARMGYYFVWFEVFSLDGFVKTFRKRVIVSAR